MKIFLSLVCLAIGGIMVETTSARVERAVGGTPISIEEAPYVVSLRRGGFHVCSGAFISTQHVLTAAHCVLSGTLRLYHTRVVSGTDKVDRNDVGHAIEEIIPHEDFLRGKSPCDIAVVKLSMHVEWNEKQKQIELPNAGPMGNVVATFIAFKTKKTKQSDVGLRKLSVKAHPIILTSANSDDSHEVLYGRFHHSQKMGRIDFGGALVYEKKIIGIAFEMPPKINRACHFIIVANFKTFIETSMENSANLNRPSVISWAPKRPRL